MGVTETILESRAKHTNRYDDVAVLIPCFNEERTVGKVVKEFSAALTGAKVIVFDNDEDRNAAEECGRDAPLQ